MELLSLESAILFANLLSISSSARRGGVFFKSRGEKEKGKSASAKARLF